MNEFSTGSTGTQMVAMVYQVKGTAFITLKKT